MLLIRDVYLGSGSASKNLSFFNLKNSFYLSEYDLGCSSRIPESDFLPIPDLGSRVKQKITGSRICNTAYGYGTYLTFRAPLTLTAIENRQYGDDKIY